MKKKTKGFLLLSLALLFSFIAVGRFFLASSAKGGETLLVGVRAAELDLALCEAISENRDAAFQKELSLNGVGCRLVSFHAFPTERPFGESREKGDILLLLTLPGKERGGSIFTEEKYLAVGMTVPLTCADFSLSVRVESLIFPGNDRQSGA